MNTSEKIARATDTSLLSLHKKGIFYKLYNQQAMLFTENIKKLKVNVELIISIVFVCSVVIILPCRGQAELVIQSKTAIDFRLQGYNGLEDIAIFSGSLPADGSQRVETRYNGLAMLIFSGGQQYPLIRPQ